MTDRNSRSTTASVPDKVTGFSFTDAMKALCIDITTRHPAFGHIDMSRVLVAFSQARKRTKYGTYASLTPMRFEEGDLTGVRRGRRYKAQRLFSPDGIEMLYILSFYLPRFMDTTFREKLVTVFHELWHISPRFDGDIRRHAGRCYAHSSSQEKYDAQMGIFVDQWLESSPPDEVYRFLELDFDALHARYRRVHGQKVRRPKLIPLAPEKTLT